MQPIQKKYKKRKTIKKIGEMAQAINPNLLLTVFFQNLSYDRILHREA